MPRRVVVTGLGFICSIGNSRGEVSAALRALRHGFAPFDFVPGTELPVKLAGTIKGFDLTSSEWPAWKLPAGAPVGREHLRSLAPHGVYAMCALHEAIRDAGLTPADLANEDTGLYAASAGSPQLARHHLNNMHEAGGRRSDPMGVVSSAPGTLNFNLGAFFGIRGANCGFVSACASSAHALGYACDDLMLGRLRRAVVVGAEDCGVDSLLPFAGMRALTPNPDPATASRPFDAARDGFVGTGGACVLILEEAEAARARGAPLLAEIAGWGQAADGYNVAISHPEGRGLARAMQRTLEATGWRPEEVEYVNAHATSTPIGDRSEALALKAVFGTGERTPLVSSTKGLTGHALSMAGALEAAFCALAISEGFTPGSAGLQNPDPVCDGLRLLRETLPSGPRRVLSNSSGFGGANVVVALAALP